MTLEEKALLRKDLSPRLPYGVKVSVNQSQLQNYDYKWKSWNFDEEPQEIDGVSIYGVTFGCMDMSDGVIGFEFIKPYLFPISSMTEEQCYKLASIQPSYQDCWKYIKTPIPLSICNFKQMEFFYENHIDYNGLIPMRLAVDATDKNIY